jgi:5'(3')-deoxyribonucleotidase
MFEEIKKRRVRKLFYNTGFVDVLNKVCSVMMSITKDGVNENSNKQYWNTWKWARVVLHQKLEEITRCEYDSVTTDYIYSYYNELVKRFEHVDNVVGAKIDDYIEKKLLEQKDEIVFAIDVDSVLRNNLGEMVKLYNEEFNEDMTVEDIKNYKTDISFPRIEEETGQTSSQWFFQDHSEELFVKAKPFENASEDVAELRKLGKVIIVTYQKTTLNKVQTLEWLDNNGIKYDGIVFVKDKSIVDCDYFIDDNDWNFNGCKASHGILINAPYNRNLNLEELRRKTYCKEIIRFNSLHDFVVELKNTKNQR